MGEPAAEMYPTPITAMRKQARLFPDLGSKIRELQNALIPTFPNSLRMAYILRFYGGAKILQAQPARSAVTKKIVTEDATSDHPQIIDLT
jgi:hypothetical protein